MKKFHGTRKVENLVWLSIEHSLACNFNFHEIIDNFAKIKARKKLILIFVKHFLLWPSINKKWVKKIIIFISFVVIKVTEVIHDTKTASNKNNTFKQLILNLDVRNSVHFSYTDNTYKMLVSALKLKHETLITVFGMLHFVLMPKKFLKFRLLVELRLSKPF